MTSIGHKALLFISASLLVFCGGLFLLSQTVRLDGYLDLEGADMQQQLNRVQKGVASCIQALDATTFDWAAWDDAYAFVETGYHAFVESNLVDEVFDEPRLRLHFMIFLNTDQNVVYGKG